ncbi:hypothetical protein RB195_021617 [Necator americanus]|uniref:Peptidase M12A domain-containing protein n=1 Tax=Necator americanus TaxID=51031 RepID=A0ABR1ECK8_NECAM
MWVMLPFLILFACARAGLEKLPAFDLVKGARWRIAKGHTRLARSSLSPPYVVTRNKILLPQKGNKKLRDAFKRAAEAWQRDTCVNITEDDNESDGDRYNITSPSNLVPIIAFNRDPLPETISIEESQFIIKFLIALRPQSVGGKESNLPGKTLL